MMRAWPSGEDAFQRCFEEHFDCVVSDITMGALSGVQLTRLFKADNATKDIPVVLLTAADDPVIPVDDFHRLHLPDRARVEITARGGHCGFLRDWRLDGLAEHWVADRLDTHA